MLELDLEVCLRGSGGTEGLRGREMDELNYPPIFLHSTEPQSQQRAGKSERK